MQAKQPTDAAVTLFKRLQQLLVGHPAGTQVWEEVLTEDDRKKLGGDSALDFQKRGAVDLARLAWGCDRAEATLRIHRVLGTLNSERLAWLGRELNVELSEPPSSASHPKPFWNPDKCELLYGDNVIRVFRGPTVAKHCVAVVEKFAAAGWPERIDNPPELRDSVRRSAALRSLNSGLKVIEFKADGSGSGIIWTK